MNKLMKMNSMSESPLNEALLGVVVSSVNDDGIPIEPVEESAVND